MLFFQTLSSLFHYFYLLLGMVTDVRKSTVNTLNFLRNAAHRGFINRSMRMMENIEYRRITNLEDLEPVIALREKAYRAHKIYVRSDQPMTDEQDLDPRFFTFGVFWQEELLSTLRVHIVTQENPVCNSRDYYPNFLDPLIAQGVTFMDPTRFAIDPDLGKELQTLPLITLRLGFLAAKHFDTDFCLSMIKERHVNFYRKVFKSSQVTPFLPFEAVHSHYALFSSSKSLENAICEDYPIFRSTQTERNLLFQAHEIGNPRVLSVKPSAEFAQAQFEKQKPEFSVAS